jgi:predicted RNA-binding protein YlxR (DUF448 family)
MAPDGAVVPDLRARLPGRGVWVGATRAEVGEAVRRKLFSRGLKSQAKADPGLADAVAARLRESALGRLGMARKAGALVAGFAKVEAALTQGEAIALVIAGDAAEDGRRKIEAAARRGYGDDGRLPVIRMFDSAELSLALGRPNVIHAAVLQSPAGKSFVEAATRLLRYEGVGAAPAPVNVTADYPQDETNG